VSVLGIGGELATEYEPSMRLMAANLDRYPLRKIVSHILPLDRAQDAVMLAQSGEAMQVALDPRLPLGSGSHLDLAVEDTAAPAVEARDG
jgi:hypothetical protein